MSESFDVPNPSLIHFMAVIGKILAIIGEINQSMMTSSLIEVQVFPWQFL